MPTQCLTKLKIDKVIISRDKFSAHTNPLYISSKILKIRDVLDFEVLKFMYEFKNKLIPSSLLFLFSYSTDFHNHETRSAELLHVPLFNTINFGKNSLRYNGVIKWNSFHRDFSEFRKLFSYYKVKKFLIAHFTSFYNT